MIISISIGSVKGSHDIKEVRFTYRNKFCFQKRKIKNRIVMISFKT